MENVVSNILLKDAGIFRFLCEFALIYTENLEGPILHAVVFIFFLTFFNIYIR